MCSCKAISKFILIIINLLFLLAGGLMLAFGIVARVKPDLIFTIFSSIPGIDKVPKAFDLGSIVNSSAIFMIVLGSVVFLVGFFGCFGACCENKCMLTVYIIVALLILCAEVALIIFGAVSPDKLRNFIQGVMKKSLEKVNQDVNITSNGFILPNEEASLGWAVLQFETHCCGAANYSDYSEYKKAFHHTINGYNYSSPVPVSCCLTKEGNIDVTKIYNLTIFVNYEDCLNGGRESINPDNCYDSIFQLLKKSLTIAIGIAAAIVGCELILITAAICLCRDPGTEGK